MPPLENQQVAHDYELSFAAARPFDFHAWLATWQREYVFFRIDAQNRIDFMAPSVREILGYEPAEMVGRDFREFFDLDHPQHTQLMELTHRLVASDPPGLRRCIVRRQDGGIAYFSLRERDVEGPSGPVGKEFMGQDVTTPVEAELSLRQSEQKYRRLVEGLKGAYIIYAHDAQGVVTYVSPSVTQVLGYDPEEVVGRKNVTDFYRDPSLGQQVNERFLSDALAGDVMHQHVGEFRHRDGSVRVLEIQKRPVFGIDGRLTAMEGIAKDVTETAAAAGEIRKLKEDLERAVALRTEQLTRINEELRASETRYRDVVETQTEFIVRYDAKGRRTFVNEAYCRFHGLEREALLGKPLADWIHPEDRQSFHDLQVEVSRERPTMTWEGRILRGGETFTWMQWTTRAFYDAHGGIGEYQSVGRDITELKTAGDLLRQKEAHLAHLSRLSTMGEMVAGIAHEVGQPLHAAKTFAEAARRNLQAGGADRVKTAIECMTEISHAVTRTVGIVRRLREFTKAQPVELEKLSINQVVREAIELSAYEVRRFGVTVRHHAPTSLPTIHGDRIQLEQLLVNLILNACQAMEQTPPEGRLLSITAEEIDGAVRLAVRDTGTGIAPEHVHRLFDAFFTTKKDGMGMGLVLCKSIAEAHGIELRHHVNDGEPGTTFVLTFPKEAQAT